MFFGRWAQYLKLPVTVPPCPLTKVLSSLMPWDLEPVLVTVRVPPVATSVSARTPRDLGPVALTVVVPPAMVSVWSAFSPVARSSSSVSV
ncbi:MAG: hypothetical protein IKH88_13220 [Prevotella sp.]|nr:hypothetical protein [Prevotella sp.]